MTTKPNPSTLHGIALKILQESNKPMTVKEITAKLLKEKTIKSKTPYNTISAILQRSKFVTKTGKATYITKS